MAAAATTTTMTTAAAAAFTSPRPTRSMAMTRLRDPTTETTASASSASVPGPRARKSSVALDARAVGAIDKENCARGHNGAVESAPPRAPTPKAPTTTATTAGAAAAAPTSSASTKATTAADKRPVERIFEYVVDAKGLVHKNSYLKGRFLGKGGFATCYEVVCERSSRKFACKLVSKRSLVKPKAKTKFKSEIKIHRALRHPNVVQFEHYFEDEDNAYILLELCRNQSLSDLLRRRKRLSEPEVRFYVRQLIDGLAYLHKNLVIHRDLKLGNLFLTADMRLKIGDFGLAASLDTVFDRKKTLCGTPNYIAPEVLTGRATTGHSFEVDIWSTGVVMYTLLVGKPPFETEDVKETYKRIRVSDFTFPEHVELSESAKSLIRSILRVEPHLRPSLNALLAHPFFQERPMPTSLPRTALLITPPECKRAIASNKRKDAMSTSSLEQERRLHPPPRPPAAMRHRETRSKSSPVKPRLRDPRDDQRATTATTATTTTTTTTTTTATRTTSTTKSQSDNNETRSSATSRADVDRKSRKSDASVSRASTATSDTPSRPEPVEEPAPIADTIERDPFEVVQHTLSRYFDLDEYGQADEKLSEDSSAAVIVAAAKRIKELRLARDAAHSQATAPATVWLSQWVDYTSKYGMGYVLSDGSAGVYFNDSTKVVASADGMTLEYMERVPELSAAPEPYARYPADQYDPSLKKKVTLLSHFKSYLIDEREKKPEISAFEKQVRGLTKDLGARGADERMVFVKKWVKTKHAILFCLSNDTFQFNFFDSSKLILSSRGSVVTYVDKEGTLGVFSTAVAILGREPSDLTKRLRYSRDMFDQIVRANRTTTTDEM